MFKLAIVSLICIISVTSVVGQFDHLCEGQLDGAFVNDDRTCEGYFLCSQGAAGEGMCPGNLYFNPNSQICDWPENVECIVATTTQSTPPTPSPTTPPTTPAPEEVECPATGSQLFPHPQSCSLFVLCFGGVATEQECPTDQHFAPHLQTCTTPAEANCLIDHTMCFGVADLTHVPSTIDCNEYFICLNWTSLRRTCAPELHFNPIELRCESRHTAGCIIGRKPEDYVPNCPIDEWFAVLPNGYSCRHFFFCLNGVGHLQECGPGLLFDVERGVCDYDSNVECLFH